MFSKLSSCVAAFLIISSLIFAQDACKPKCKPAPCPQPKLPTQVCPADPCCPPWASPLLNAAYNYPARHEVHSCWDFSFDASFIYWQPSQENMELAVADQNNTTPIIGSFSNMDFSYKPGFKIGANGYLNYDNWDVRAEYTWFHSNQKESTSAPLGGALLSLWQPPSGFGDSLSITEKWKLYMDIAELNLGRSYYLGTKLTLRPNFGLRAAWIRQKVSTTASVLTFIGSIVTSNSHSWGLGASAGFDADWQIGKGFRFLGNAQGDLLFTDYTSLSFKSTIPAVPSEDFFIKQKSVYAVKPHIDLELGLGWGTYFDCNKWYLDFAASYGFQVFFDQNMFRHFYDNQMAGNSRVPNGNLYVQGLTLTAKLDF